MPSLNFVVDYLNQEFQMVESATLAVEAPSLPSFDAVAVFDVDIEDMKRIFQYQTDGIDTTNVDGSDIKYYIKMDQWPSNLVLNPAHAMMDSPLSQSGFDIADSNITSAKKLVKHDLLRYLALKLFNTTRAVDLMSNETELKENMATLCGSFNSSVWKNIRDLLVEISTQGTDAELAVDASGLKHLTNSLRTNKNIVRTLINQISQYDSARFNSMDAAEVDELNRPVPFIEGDILNFTVRFSAANDQHNLTGVSPIPDRTYLIKIHITSAPSNTAVSDSVFVGDFAYSPYVSQIIPFSAAAVVADACPPTARPSGYNTPGWYYKNNAAATTVNGRKINWYVSPATSTTTVGDIQTLYYTAEVLNKDYLPFIVVYTKKTGSGDAASWYKSKRVFIFERNSSQIKFNRNCQLSMELVAGTKAACLIDGLQHLDLTVDLTNTDSNKGAFAPTEEILAISLQTDSAAPNGASEFILTSIASVEVGGKKVYHFAPTA
jgi:hypothetical protein